MDDQSESKVLKKILLVSATWEPDFLVENANMNQITSDGEKTFFL